MKDKKIKGTLFALLTVIALLLTSASSLGFSVQTNNVQTSGARTLVCIDAVTTTLTTSPYGILDISDFGASSYDNSGNIVIANSTANESFPSMVVFDYKRSLVAYEKENDGDLRVVLRNSADYGQTWPNSIELVVYLNKTNTNIESKTPSICLNPNGDKYVYGVFVSPFNDSGVNGIFKAPDVGSNLNEVEVSSLDWSNDEFYGYEKPDIVAFDDTDNPWVAASIGSTDNPLGPAKDTPMFMYDSLTQPGKVTTAWFPGITNCSNISIANDFGDDTVYGVCEFYNDTRTEILFFEGNPHSWTYDDDLINMTFYDPIFNSNLTHPQIFVNGDDIYIAAEQSGWFLGEYRHGCGIFHSPDGGDSWDVLLPVNETMFPQNETTVQFPNINVDDSKIYFTFLEDNDIYLTNASKSDTDHWSEPVQLNSENHSVVEDFRFSTIADKDHVVWTDNREGTYDIYSFLKALPSIDLMVLPESLNITTGEWWFIPTKHYIEFTVRNNGSQPVENVEIQITYTCLSNDPTPTEYEGYIIYLAPGGEVSFTKPLFELNFREFLDALRSFSGINKVTVTVDPYGNYDDEFPLNNMASIATNYSYIFPRLAWLEDIMGVLNG